MSYTQLAVLAVALAVALDLVVLRTSLLRRKAFWTAYAIVLAFELVMNGVLAGTGFVRYAPAAFSGIRIAFAPAEDLLFGFSMVLVTLSCWVWLGRREVRRASRQRPRPVRRDVPSGRG